MSNITKENIENIVGEAISVNINVLQNRNKGPDLDNFNSYEEI